MHSCPPETGRGKLCPEPHGVTPPVCLSTDPAGCPPSSCGHWGTFLGGGGTPLVCAGLSARDLAADGRVGVFSLAGTELWAGLGCPRGPSTQPQRGPWWDVCRAPKHSYGLRGHCPGRPGFRRAGHTPSWLGQDLGLRETSDGPVS